ncbi:MAG: TetR/AcrR family transcriptional regulator [Desulfobacterales bacterium]|nr:TetR/AcrR family transcriptional regulator [Desulfobacterales bacterium]
MLSRREREKERQRQEMMTAALNLFSEKGYHNVTMHEIAGKAEFAVGTIYKFFRNKEDLYKALILEKAQELKTTILEAVGESADEVDKLRNFVRAKGEIFRAQIPVVRLYFSETHGESFSMLAGLDAEVRTLHNEFLKELAAIFAAGVAKKRFKKTADPYYLAVALDGITTAFLFLWLEAPERHSYPENPDVILNILFKGLLDQ